MKDTLNYSIDRRRNLVIKEHYGRISLEDEIAFMTRIFSDPAFAVGMDFLCDLGHADIDWGLREMDKFRSFLSKHIGLAEHSKWALITAGGPTEHNARIFIKLNESIGGRIDMRLFTSRDEALAWFSGQPADNPVRK